MSQGEGSKDTQSQRKKPPGPPGSGRRLGISGTSGALSVKYEEIPDDLEADAVYWYARYRELEKSYMDLGQQLEQFHHQQKSREFFRDTSDEDYREIYRRFRNLVGIFTGVLVLLNILALEGLINLPPEILVGAAIAITTVVDAVSLPSLLGKAWEKIIP